jgi:hypothetical protein
MAGIGLNPSQCCCSPTCACPPCPAAVGICRSLTISWTNGLIGPGATGLLYLGGCVWQAVCVVATPATYSFRFDFDMSGATPVLRIRIYTASGCTGATSVDCTFLTGYSLSCATFVYSLSSFSSSCPGLASRGFSNFTITL